MIRIQLSDREADRLEQAFLQATDRKFRDRLQIVRLAHRGRPHQDIAADLGITPRTVQRWLNAYLERGLDGLTPRKAKGRETGDPGLDGRRDPPLGDRGAGRARARPGQLDPRRTGRPPEEGPRHLGQPLGHAAVLPQARHPALPPHVPLICGATRSKQAEAAEELADLGTKAEAGELVLLSQDEARFPMVPTLGATLGVKGHRPRVGTDIVGLPTTPRVLCSTPFGITEVGISFRGGTGGSLFLSRRESPQGYPSGLSTAGRSRPGAGRLPLPAHSVTLVLL